MIVPWLRKLGVRSPEGRRGGHGCQSHAEASNNLTARKKVPFVWQTRTQVSAYRRGKE